MRGVGRRSAGRRPYPSTAPRGPRPARPRAVRATSPPRTTVGGRATPAGGGGDAEGRRAGVRT
ncbi:hypothetical protein FTX61_00745 [Nitriliruptoraceae bacterium ZYF776]|nr:hypothetical protein [Profundirhabdus halotolerans]